ncbi:hypothetical protein [Pseudoalteromonas denitrificans]|nr:hypothetical protein [Pseudoalteromonas denitrificans]
MKAGLIFISLFLSSNYCYAVSSTSQSVSFSSTSDMLPVLYASSNNISPTIFIKNEIHGNDSIVSFGLEVPLKKSHSNFGAYVTSALGYAEVTDKTNHQNNFLTLDTGLKFGYFSDISIYGEVGIDLFDTFLNGEVFDSEKDDDEYDYHNTKSHDSDVDGYIGVGIGIDLKPIKVEAFTRIRQIDSHAWEAKEHIFSGIQVSISL